MTVLSRGDGGVRSVLDVVFLLAPSAGLRLELAGQQTVVFVFLRCGRMQTFADTLGADYQVRKQTASVSGLLFVIARNSTFFYKGKPVKISQVAEELGVRYVLEGSVQRAGNQVRVNAQLIDALTGGHVWADRFNGSVTDIFAVQDEFVSKIGEALQITLTSTEKEEIEHAKPNNIAAKEAFERGWNLYLRFNLKDSFEAVRHFEKAIEIDPEYGRAYAALSLVYLRASYYGWNQDFGALRPTQVSATLQLAGWPLPTRRSRIARHAGSCLRLPFTFPIEIWEGGSKQFGESLFDGFRIAGLPLDVNVPILIGELSGDDPFARQLAMRRLGWFGAAAADAVPALVQALDDEALRQEAVGTLGKIGPPAKPAIGALRALQDKSVIGTYAQEALKRYP